MELLYEAATVHRKYHDPNSVQVSSLLSIKTGGCSEDCAYCPQSARYETEVKIEDADMMSVSQVKAQTLRAKSAGASRVCMGAAWRNVKDGPEFEQVFQAQQGVAVQAVLRLGLVQQIQPLGGGFGDGDAA